MRSMTSSAIVLASVILGLVAGSLATWAVLTARSLGQQRATALRPELPEVAVQLLDAVESYAVILDASLSVVYANPIAKEHPQLTGEELRDPQLLQRARRVLTTGISDTQMPDADDPLHTVSVQIVRIEHRFVAVFARDVGEEQRVNAMRRDFIANVSHELKTPIAAISLLSEAVHEAAESPEIVTSFAKKLMKESRRLGDLSRDIIQLSEAQSTLRPEDREPVSLRAFVSSEVEAHRNLATQHGVTMVITDADADTPDPVTLGRPGAIAMAISNLLNNAIRHSPEGGRVGIGIETTKRKCIITVTDQGEGIAAEHLPRIFERFYRVDLARSRAEGGTGLGLSIARHTMRAHGGSIEVWSQPGVGSSFTLTFPTIDDTKPKRKKEKKSSKKPKSESAGNAQNNTRESPKPSKNHRKKDPK